MGEDILADLPNPGHSLGPFQYCRMTIGLLGAPASFQHLMDTLLRDLPLVTTHWDDVLIHSPSIEEHQSHLKVILISALDDS